MHMSSPQGQFLDTHDTMSESSNNASRLHRSKSTTSVKDRKKHPLPSQPLDPETSRVHALIAAHRAMDRSQSKSSTDIGRSDSNMSRTSATKKSQNVHFSPATQLRRQRSALQSRAPHLSAALRVPPDQRQDDPYLDTIVSDFGAVTENYGSEPSSYRRLRRARSMLTPRRRLFSNPSSPVQTPFSQAPTLRTATSSTGLAQPGLGLRIKRSFTFLRPASRMSPPQRPDTHLGRNDEAIRLARTQFLNDMEEKQVKKKSSILALPKIRRPHKAFRNSVRSSQLRETDDSVISDTPSLDIPRPEQSKRSFSASLRDRVFKAFRKSTTGTSTLPPQKVEATRQHFSQADDGGTSSFDNYHIDQDDRRESFYVASKPEQEVDEERDQFPSTLHTAGSRESLHSNARSRVTSWTNSSMSSSTVRGQGLERNRLSIIKEDGGPHQPSCSAGRHMGGISVFQDVLETEDEHGIPYPPIDSQRIYSALMKRIGEEEAEIEYTQAALEEIHGNQYGDLDPFGGGMSTIRTVSATTIGTEAAAREQKHHVDDSDPQNHQYSTLTPVLHQQNVERRKVKLASQEEQSSFFPFSDQGQPQTPSPFRKLLEQRRSETLSDEFDDDALVDTTNSRNKPGPSKFPRGLLARSSESIYSQTTNGGENPSFVPPIVGSEDLTPITQEVHKDTGMATIISSKYKAAERPKLRSADSSERREWKGWAEDELDASLGRRDYSKAGIHYREHAQIDPDDVQLSKDTANRPSSKASAANRFPLLDLKEVPRNFTPTPKRSSSLTKSQSGLLKRASTFGFKSSSERNDENKKIGASIRKLSPANIANLLKEKKSQILTSRPLEFNKENKFVSANDSPQSSSPPMSTPGRLGLQMRSGNGRLRKRASETTVRPGQNQHVTPKNVSTPLRFKAIQYDESPTDRVKQSLSARLSRPFNMDVPEPNRPFDSMYLGKQDINLNGDRLSTAPNPAHGRTKGYGGLGPNPFGAEDTALPEIRSSTGENKLTGTQSTETERAGWSSKRMVSDFLKKRRLGRSTSTEDAESRPSKEEGMSPAFM